MTPAEGSTPELLDSFALIDPGVALCRVVYRSEGQLISYFYINRVIHHAYLLSSAVLGI